MHFFFWCVLEGIYYSLLSFTAFILPQIQQFFVVFIWYLPIYILCSNLKFRLQTIQHLKGKRKKEKIQNTTKSSQPPQQDSWVFMFLYEINISVRYGHVVRHFLCHISTNILCSPNGCDCSLVKEWQYIKHCTRHVTCMYSVPQTHRDILLSSWLIKTPEKLSKFISENWTHDLLKSIITVASGRLQYRQQWLVTAATVEWTLYHTHAIVWTSAFIALLFPYFSKCEQYFPIMFCTKQSHQF